MDKYIVEIDGKNICSDSDGKSKLALSVKSDNGYAVFCTEIPLTPYTEPDLEQVRKEAYEKGQKDLRDSCVPQDEEAYGIGYNEGYAQGLADVWDAARKIENLPETEKFEIFGEYDMFHIMRRYTATEAIEKIRQYEQEQEKIKRGDEVITQSGETIVVTCPLKNDDLGWLDGIGLDGRVYSFLEKNCTKTGKHYSEIAEFFRKMGEN